MYGGYEGGIPFRLYHMDVIRMSLEKVLEYDNL